MRGAAGLPREELVRTGAHRLKNEIRFCGRGDREHRDAGVAGSKPFDGRHPRRGVVPDVDEDDIGSDAFGCGAAFGDADGHAAGAHQTRDLPFEFFVLADDECCQLCHGLLIPILAPHHTSMAAER